ncbi:hypothetical protein [Singulisphaera sp. PoT]|uniref:hypothetical protein n=1 Tax=Singulisphaera sp. PoT TaxID=3411797 RepID=UPI003BF5BB69
MARLDASQDALAKSTANDFGFPIRHQGVCENLDFCHCPKGVPCYCSLWISCMHWIREIFDEWVLTGKNPFGNVPVPMVERGRDHGGMIHLTFSG